MEASRYGGNMEVFDMTACVFAWEDKADESGKFMRAEMQRYVDKYWMKK